MNAEKWDSIVKRATSTDFMNDLYNTEDTMNNRLAEMRATVEKRIKMEDELSLDNRAEITLIEETEEDWREKEYIKVSFPKNKMDLIQAHLRIYERFMGKKEREEFQQAIYSAYVGSN